jgi:integrase
MAAGIRGDLPEGERKEKFAGHSLRAGLVSSAEVDERYIQKQLGHVSAEMIRRYQRRRVGSGCDMLDEVRKEAL